MVSGHGAPEIILWSAHCGIDSSTHIVYIFAPHAATAFLSGILDSPHPVATDPSWCAVHDCNRVHARRWFPMNPELPRVKLESWAAAQSEIQFILAELKRTPPLLLA